MYIKSFIENRNKKIKHIIYISLFLFTITFTPRVSLAQDTTLCPPEKYKQILLRENTGNAKFILRMDSILNNTTLLSDSLLDYVGGQQNLYGDWNGAIATFTKLLERCKTRDDSAKYYFKRANAEQYCSPDLSYNDCQLSIKLNPRYGGYWLRASFQNSDTAELKDMTTHIDIVGIENVNYMTLYIRGKRRFQIKDFKGAEEDMNAVLKKEPLWGEAYNYKAKINRETGKVDCNILAEAIYWGHPEFKQLLQEKCPSLNYKTFLSEKYKQNKASMSKGKKNKLTQH